MKARDLGLAALVFSSVLLNVTGAASASETEGCPLGIQLRALGSVSSARHAWKALYGHYKAYGQCDAGPIAEGYSYDVVELLSSKWLVIDEMTRLTTQDPGFLRFLLAHVDDQAETNDLEIIRDNARNACPRKQHLMCRQLADRAESALSRKASAAAAR